MLFNSYAFVFLFLPVVLLGYYFIPKKRIQLWFLFFSSVVFYAYWSKTFVFLLLFTVALDFYIAKVIYKTEKANQRKLLLLISISINLLVLGFFKYADFLIGTYNSTLASLFNLSQANYLNLILPIGISFYTFQSMSYVIDVYRRTSNAHAGLLEFAGYVTLFPHQISGPLVRHNQIVPQLERNKTYLFNSENFWQGISLFILGLSKKILIADRIAPVVDILVGNMALASTAEAWLSILGYTMQLYFDFSGYTDMAIGLGLMMNIQFPINFNSPYKSASITEFWRRWHITLSSWLRDYLYISLGGNRNGRFKTYRNLFLTMVIGGLWHGANWTFVVWGMLHGAALMIEKYLQERKIDFIRIMFLKKLFTFLFVLFAWIFFRSPDFKTAWIWIHKLIPQAHSLSFDLILIPLKYKDRFFIALAIALILAFFAKNNSQIKWKPRWLTVVSLGLLAVLCLTYFNEESPFLYFQF